MPFDEKTENKKAWKVAGDPTASEKQWLSACTVLKDGSAPKCRGTSMPPFLGLVWSTLLSLLSAAGGGFVFLITTVVVFATWLNLLPGIYPDAVLTYVAGGLCAIGIAFSSVFTYQRHLWKGGLAWSLTHATIVGLGGFSPLISYIAMTGSIPSMEDLAGHGMLALAVLGSSLLSSKLTGRAINNLNATVGAHRSIGYCRILLPAVTVVYAAMCLLSVLLPSVFFTTTGLPLLWIITLGLLGGSTFAISRKNQCFNPVTSVQLSLGMWSPLILTCLILFPLLAINAILYATAGPIFSINLFDVLAVICIGSVATLVPSLGALIASRSLRADRVRELHRLPVLTMQENSQSETQASAQQLNSETA